MKKTFLLALAALLLIACGKSDRLLTSATGTIYECLVVADKPVYDIVKQTLAADMYGLPQPEAYLEPMQVSMAQFDNYLKPTRNILIIEIDGHKYTQVSAKTTCNQWAKPQAVYRITAPSEEALAEFWTAHGEAVREWFIREELSRQIRFYRASTNKEARAKLNKQGYDLLIPEDYMFIMDTTLADTRVLWCCNNKGPMRRDVLVYSYPYTAQEQFSNDSIVTKRNVLLGRLVSAQVQGSHMGTEFKYFPPQSRQVPALQDTVGGFYAVETRGLWKILDGEAMGGPFVSLTRLDQVNGRVVTAETFLFASGQKKRNALRQAEAILYSLKMPQDK